MTTNKRYSESFKRKVVTARRSGQPALVVALAEKASLRLHKKFRNLQ
ncbi:hypothetical protein CLV95_12458, partial [Leptospira borgpetersenii serovar Javanica]